METYRDLSALKFQFPTAVGLGNFDGVHVGHQILLTKLKELSKKNNLKSVVITFEPHPSRVLTPHKAAHLITTSCQKENIIRSFGIDFLVVSLFTREFSRINYTDFIYDYLIKKYNAKLVIVGYDYKFGYMGKGNASRIKQICNKEGISVVIVPPVRHEGKVVSSTLIRSLIKTGAVRKASEYLGRNFSIEGKIIHGDGVGTKLGYPTANICIPDNVILPARGVYAVLALWGGLTYQGVANLGYKPTFNGNEIRLEVHIFNFNKDIYGKEIKVEFVDIIRKEVKFNSVEQLVAQVKNDSLAAKSILSKFCS
ncbi:MAG: bifunctional riboflavin kinase/FAD synthetase [Tepidanaerobacteraceae bacterium]|jgi:riboflavin kinase/FMN adenylyltransferase